MKVEFLEKLQYKKALIEKVNRKCKEMALTDTMVICTRCRLDIAQVKTLEFVNEQLHWAKCAFGMLRRLEFSTVL